MQLRRLDDTTEKPVSSKTNSNWATSLGRVISINMTAKTTAIRGLSDDGAKNIMPLFNLFGSPVGYLTIK